MFVIVVAVGIACVVDVGGEVVAARTVFGIVSLSLSSPIYCRRSGC